MWPQNELMQSPEQFTCRLERISAEAAQNRMLRQAGLNRRPWLACQACRALWRLGHLMVTAGQRLEQRYAATRLDPA